MSKLRHQSFNVSPINSVSLALACQNDHQTVTTGKIGPVAIWLVVLPILKNMSSSMERMTSHILWKIKNVWNHQPAMGQNSIPLKLDGYVNYITGWWFQPTPLKNDGVRQLGWWHSQYMENHKSPYIMHVFPYINHIIQIFQSTNLLNINRQRNCGSKILTLRELCCEFSRPWLVRNLLREWMACWGLRLDDEIDS